MSMQLYDDNALIHQLLAPLEVGHEVDTAAKAHKIHGRERFPMWGRWGSKTLNNY